MQIAACNSCAPAAGLDSSERVLEKKFDHGPDLTKLTYILAQIN